LLEHGSLRVKDVGGNRSFESTLPHFGIGAGTGGEVSRRDVQSWYDVFSAKAGAGIMAVDNPFLRHFGPMLSTALFLENRLAAVNATNSFDYTAQKPSNDLQALLLNSNALEKYRSEIQSTFGKAIGLDITRGGFLSLRVSENPKASALDWVTPSRVRAMRPIEAEGDGLRSYSAVCVGLLLGARPICLIDEPEICLHGPQEYAVGRFIGAYGTQDETATVIATHSSQILRGILETATELRIVRLVKTGQGFVGRLVDRALIEESLRRPAARSDVILQGIFSDAVTIVESDTDRVVYNAALGVANPLRRRDTYFAPVAGTAGIADPVQFYRSLHIPVAVIADLDLILEPPVFSRIVEKLSMKARARELETMCSALANEIAKQVPTLPETDVRSRLEVLAGSQLDWSRRDDEHLVQDLRALAASIDRKKRVKTGGIQSFSEVPSLKANLESLVSQCAEIGLFLVPVGELECWSPGLMKGVAGRDQKAKWANEFIKRLAERPEEAKDVIGFVRVVDAFHTAESDRLTSATANEPS